MVETKEQLTTIVNNYINAIWIKKDLSKLDDFFNQDATFRSPLAEVKGLGAIKAHFQTFLDRFSDLKVEIADIFAQNNKAACFLRVSGKFSKNFLGPTPSQEVSFDSASFFLFKNNKIQECTVMSDYGLLSQLGAAAQQFKGKK
jgi:predicted ester cyclase